MTGTLTPTRPSETCGGSVCGSYRPGHNTHWIQARLMGRSDDVPVGLAPVEDGAVRLTGERTDAVGSRRVDVVARHHDRARLARAVALAAGGAPAVLDARRHALRIEEPGGARVLVLSVELPTTAE